jgi:hypothetical protein
MSERLRELLLKAVRNLEPDEQNEVLGELLLAGSTVLARPAVQDVSFPPFASVSRLRQRIGSSLTEELSTTLAFAAGDVKVLPVRLPEADYERLRAWSKENGFSMAVIIRTLVERFLDGQGAPRSQPTAD